MTTMEQEPAATLRGMAAGELTEASPCARMADVEESGLDARVHALVRLAALVALDAAPPSYARLLPAALRSGATVDDVVAVLVALAPQVGEARVVAGAERVVRVLDAAAVPGGA